MPYAGIPSEVWIAEDPDEGDAMGLIRDFLKRDSAPLAPKSAWECAHFREGNPGQFDVTFHTDLKRSGGDALESALAAASHIG